VRFRLVPPRTLTLAGLVLLAGCGTVEEVRLSFSDATPHEAYVESLRAAGLGDAALTGEWIEASQRAIQSAAVIDLPFQEEGYLFPEEADARGYGLSLRRGQQLSVDVSLVEEGATRLFVDVFRLREGRDPLSVMSTDSLLDDLAYTAMTDADYVVRIQPELLRGGQYRVTLRVDASMAFPVQGHDTRAIQSFFGAERDAGRRSHHGVDIFARRNTPVLSATDGIVSRVDVTSLGGKVVWVRDSDQPQSIYYAHLDSQLVVRGDRVRRGDPVGLVGNSGNARTTPPHLHFGIYRRGQGPVNPYWYLYRPDQEFGVLAASTEGLGSWNRTLSGGIRLRSGPSRGADVVEELPEHTALRVEAASGDWYRVRMPDGRIGWIAARLTESAGSAIERTVLTDSQILRAHPTLDGAAVAALAPGTDVEVLGRYGTFLFVRADQGRPGWLAEISRSTDD